MQSFLVPGCQGCGRHHADQQRRNSYQDFAGQLSHSSGQFFSTCLCSPRGPLVQGCLRLNNIDGQTFGSISQALKDYWNRTQHDKCFSISVDLNRGDHKLTGYEMAYRPPAKLDCFCTQKKINELTFSQAQTSLRGGPIPALHLVFMISSLKLSETRMLISFYSCSHTTASASKPKRAFLIFILIIVSSNFSILA